jgi:hypothetical protein
MPRSRRARSPPRRPMVRPPRPCPPSAVAAAEAADAPEVGSDQGPSTRRRRATRVRKALRTAEPMTRFRATPPPTPSVRTRSPTPVRPRPAALVRARAAVGAVEDRAPRRRPRPRRRGADGETSQAFTAESGWLRRATRPAVSRPGPGAWAAVAVAARTHHPPIRTGHGHHRQHRGPSRFSRTSWSAYVTRTAPRRW